MEQILVNFYKRISDFCQPDPKSYPNLSVRQMVHDRNLLHFYSFSLFPTVFAISSVVLKLPANTALSSVGFGSLSFLLFSILRRSYIWIFNYLFAIGSIVIQFIILGIFEETAYCQIGQFFLLLTNVLIMTGDIWLAFCLFLLQAFTLMTRFKEKIAFLIQEESPEVFADNVVKHILVALVLIFVINTTLVKSLERRTIELSKAKMDLENALEQQKTFVFSFSHELRNPINSLLGNLQLVLQAGEAFSPKVKEMLNTAKVCGEILLHNINNVLDTGKYEIGKLEVNLVPTQLNELFQRTWGIYSELFRQKKLKSQLRIEKDLPPVVKIDSHKVNQVLLNLIGNAIKFTERGSASVTVKWLQNLEVCNNCFEPIPYDDIDEGLFEKEDNLSILSRIPDTGFLGGRSSSNSNIPQHHSQSKGVLKIIVKDTGPGMKAEALEKLFKKFSQVSENVSQRNIGTGLGLFITKEICNAMNGEIRAYSRFNKGTTFVVCIPTTSVPMTNVQRTDSESILQELSTKHLKVIVADDSPFNVNLICDYFAKFAAFVASVAYNGYDAFQKYQECKTANTIIDIVTLDIDMPILDGRKTCDKIREYEKENKLKPALIILISGNYDKEQIEEYLDPNRGHKADCFLRKPVSFSEFHRAVYTLVFQD